MWGEMWRSLMNHFINLRLEKNSLLKNVLLERCFGSAASLCVFWRTHKKKKFWRQLLNGRRCCRSSFSSLPVKSNASVRKGGRQRREEKHPPDSMTGKSWQRASAFDTGHRCPGLWWWRRQRSPGKVPNKFSQSSILQKCKVHQNRDSARFEKKKKTAVAFRR